MSAKCTILMVLLNLGAAAPDPDPFIQIDVQQQVNTGCRGRGCNGGPNNDLSCMFGNRKYPNGACLKETCLELNCIKGVWKFAGTTNKDCGNCGVHGNKPTFLLFDKYKEHRDAYYFNGRGTYVITQNELKATKQSGLNAKFESCGDSSDPYITSTTYYEPGIEIDVILPARNSTNYCIDHSNDPQCEIKVFANKKLQSIGKSVNSYDAKDGTVLVIKNNHIGDEHVNVDDFDYGDNLTCINIVGSTGFSVTLCQYLWDYAYLHVRAMPTMKSIPSNLYGLCNTFTGAMAEYYIARNGSLEKNATVFVESWKIAEPLPLTSSLCPIKSDWECGCHYYNGGCIISNLEWAPANKACKCVNYLALTCRGDVVDCGQHTSPDCINTGLDLGHCVQGNGNCAGYGHECDCSHHSHGIFKGGGCILKDLPPPNIACDCSYEFILTCGGRLTYCTDFNSIYCENPQLNYPTCKQGRGDCDGY